MNCLGRHPRTHFGSPLKSTGLASGQVAAYQFSEWYQALQSHNVHPQSIGNFKSQKHSVLTVVHEVSVVEGHGTLGQRPGPCQFEGEQKKAAHSGSELKFIVEEVELPRAWRVFVGGCGARTASSGGKKFCSVEATDMANDIVANRYFLRDIVMKL